MVELGGGEVNISLKLGVLRAVDQGDQLFKRVVEDVAETPGDRKSVV
jgi:hypothetical protein